MYLYLGEGQAEYPSNKIQDLRGHKMIIRDEKIIQKNNVLSMIVFFIDLKWRIL